MKFYFHPKIVAMAMMSPIFSLILCGIPFSQAQFYNTPQADTGGYTQMSVNDAVQSRMVLFEICGTPSDLSNQDLILMADIFKDVYQQQHDIYCSAGGVAHDHRLNLTSAAILPNEVIGLGSDPRIVPASIDFSFFVQLGFDCDGCQGTGYDVFASEETLIFNRQNACQVPSSRRMSFKPCVPNKQDFIAKYKQAVMEMNIPGLIKVHGVKELNVGANDDECDGGSTFESELTIAFYGNTDIPDLDAQLAIVEQIFIATYNDLNVLNPLTCDPYSRILSNATAILYDTKTTQGEDDTRLSHHRKGYDWNFLKLISKGFSIIDPSDACLTADVSGYAACGGSQGQHCHLSEENGNLDSCYCTKDAASSSTALPTNEQFKLALEEQFSILRKATTFTLVESIVYLIEADVPNSCCGWPNHMNLPVDVDGIEFGNAITNYLQTGTSVYGYPLNCWNVSSVMDMSYAFSIVPNLYNEILSCWNDNIPISSPSVIPSSKPYLTSSASPSVIPSTGPSGAPSMLPSVAPSVSSSVNPSSGPSDLPSRSPSSIPSAIPTTSSPSASPPKLSELSQLVLLDIYATPADLANQDLILTADVFKDVYQQEQSIACSSSNQNHQLNLTSAEILPNEVIGFGSDPRIVPASIDFSFFVQLGFVCEGCQGTGYDVFASEETLVMNGQNAYQVPFPSSQMYSKPCVPNKQDFIAKYSSAVMTMNITGLDVVYDVNALHAETDNGECDGGSTFESELTIAFYGNTDIPDLDTQLAIVEQIFIATYNDLNVLNPLTCDPHSRILSNATAILYDTNTTQGDQTRRQLNSDKKGYDWRFIKLDSKGICYGCPHNGCLTNDISGNAKCGGSRRQRHRHLSEGSESSLDSCYCTEDAASNSTALPTNEEFKLALEEQFEILRNATNFTLVESIVYLIEVEVPDSCCGWPNHMNLPVDVDGVEFGNAITNYLSTGTSIYGTPINCWDVSSVMDMSYAFRTVPNLFNEALSCWNVSIPTDSPSVTPSMPSLSPYPSTNPSSSPSAIPSLSPSEMPSPSPTITPFPTPDPETAGCELMARIECSILSGAAQTCQDIAPPSMNSCVGNNTILTNLRFRYTGSNCGIDVTGVDCQDNNGGPNGSSEVFIVVSDREFGDYISEIVQLNDFIDISNPSGFTEDEIRIDIFEVDLTQNDNQGDRLQRLDINVQCEIPNVLGQTPPLVLAQERGGLQLTAFTTVQNGEQNLFVEVQIAYSILNDGALPAFVDSAVIDSSLSGAANERIQNPVRFERFEEQVIFRERAVLALPTRAGDILVFGFSVSGRADTIGMVPCSNFNIEFFTIGPLSTP